MAQPHTPLSLVADVGGTNTRVALADGSKVLVATIRHYRNADFPDLESMLRLFTEDAANAEISAACVAVAGPVLDRRVRMTNLNWTVDAEMIARATGAATVSILNDLQAQGHALGHIASDRIRTIIPALSAGPRATRLVIGIGTGFNAAVVHETDAGRVIPASESGQITLPVRDAADLRLSQFVSSQTGHPSVEDVVSGPGLARIHAWLGQESNAPAEMTSRDILARCIAGNDARAVAAARIFTRILGAVAGNLALIHLPFGGIYLIGGMARAFGPLLADFGFTDAFRDKGRYAGFMTHFGVSVIDDDDAALTGAAAHLAESTNVPK